MIKVIASISYDSSKSDELREILNWIVPLVHAEAGCRKYLPTVDCPMGLAIQETDSRVFTMVEEWEDEASLQAHLAAPHMDEFRERVQGIVTGVTVKVLKDF